MTHEKFNVALTELCNIVNRNLHYRSILVHLYLFRLATGTGPGKYKHLSVTIGAVVPESLDI
jgi:hypothetical protein